MGQASSGFFHGTSSRGKDTVNLNNLQLTLSIPNDAVDDATAVEIRPQVVLLSLAVTETRDPSKKTRSGIVPRLIDHSAICTTLGKELPNSPHDSLEHLLDHTFKSIFTSHPEIPEAIVIASLRDTSPRIAVREIRRRSLAPSTEPRYQFVISGLAVSVRKNPSRDAREQVGLEIAVHRQHSTGNFPFFGLSASLRKTFAGSDHSTLEALALAVAKHVVKHTNLKNADDSVTVRVSKPSILPFAASAEVQITRQAADLIDDTPAETSMVAGEESVSSGSSSLPHTVALGLSSNLGDRFANIETALRLLELTRPLLASLSENAIQVITTSFMYETTRSEVVDNPLFAYCACLIETNLSPMQLLELLEKVKTEIPNYAPEPCAVYFDILKYGDQRMTVNDIAIPPSNLCEHEFMLRPLKDLDPEFVHPVHYKTVHTLLEELVHSQEKDTVSRVMPFPRKPWNDTGLANIRGVPPTAKYWVMPPTYPSKNGRSSKTYVMAVLDVAPCLSPEGGQDDFISVAKANATNAVSSGADIIDIVGCPAHISCGPVSLEEELQRVVQVIKAIRKDSDHNVRDVLISINTSRWEVAEAAVEAGANCISEANCIHDVYPLMGPDHPLEDDDAKARSDVQRLAKALSVPVVLAHSPGKTREDADDSADPSGIVSVIQTELGGKVRAMVHPPKPVRRWLVFINPGIGSGKSVKGQLALMGKLSQVTAADEPGNLLADYPLLFGGPDENDLGAMLGGPQPEDMTPQKRESAVAAAVSCAVQQGASVVRVRAVAKMKGTVALASAIWGQ